MVKYFKLTGLFAGLTFLFWLLTYITAYTTFSTITMLLTIACILVTVYFLIIAICSRIKENISPYKLFAILDLVFGLIVTIYAVYDILTDTGWFAGLLGTLLLIFIVPICIVLLIIDLILWRRSKRMMN